MDYGDDEEGVSVHQFARTDGVDGEWKFRSRVTCSHSVPAHEPIPANRFPPFCGHGVGLLFKYGVQIRLLQLAPCHSSTPLGKRSAVAA